MQTIVSTVECPRCKEKAFEQYEYNTGRCKGWCNNCNYNYAKRKKVIAQNKDFEVSADNGYGIVCLVKIDGSSHYYMFNADIERIVIDRFVAYLDIPEVDAENSYMVNYGNDAFYVLYGKVPENFIDIYIETLKCHKPFLEAVDKRYLLKKG
ncbi:hypothetical protein [Lysinibacillus sp. SGAir0095]|uniref:hypothetical protein n=1 Tax=Lysinibacillus sp. SGAir0095 TaxID=2070463 RepID=UPI0010CD0E4D|nr:hypothetical protein [Lysinibacillus sp. SGAir0095]QCR30990.1 hypothetical protein C1N55_01895 [Lysinibacillus sp. SGAir0095]